MLCILPPRIHTLLPPTRPFRGPAAAEATAVLLLAVARVADACHTDSREETQQKRNKKDVIYKFP